MRSPRKAALGAAATLALALSFSPSAGADDASLRKALARQMGAAGLHSGAYVYNASDARPILRWRHGRARMLASNTKLFTTAAALARFGTEGTLGTEVLGRATPDEQGIWDGDLYLRGSGDPTFGSRRFARRSYGGGATVETLAARVQAAGIAEVRGAVVGDEHRFDSRRGGPASGYRTSIYVGPLSALAFNRGLSRGNGSAFQTRPPLFAATRLERALERRGVRVSRPARVGRTPSDARVVASVDSPPMARLARITNKPSDNFFAEMLVKGLGFEATGRGTTGRGARVAARFARRLGARARLADGSGLSRANRASPYRVARLLLAMQARDEFTAFFDSLAIAGRDGTLAPRMRAGPARSRCRGKTGTLSSVSALSGYCTARSGDVYVFSILMNGVNVFAARRLQDRMAQAIAGVRD